MNETGTINDAAAVFSALLGELSVSVSGLGVLGRILFVSAGRLGCGNFVCEGNVGNFCDFWMAFSLFANEEGTSSVVVRMADGLRLMSVVAEI